MGTEIVYKPLQKTSDQIYEENKAYKAVKQQIIVSIRDFVGAGTVNLITVPAGKVLFITSAFISVHWDTNDANEASVYLYSTQTNSDILISQMGGNAYVADKREQSDIAITFSDINPVKLEEGKELKLFVIAQATAAAGITGFLVDKKEASFIF